MPHALFMVPRTGILRVLKSAIEMALFQTGCQDALRL